ncbi:GNAT family N-acetyltransferase [Apilactobacillus kunkeei]|uniref:GNAT family N-acetyltransferase n=1 Tax=Apilactobacillus kunkeei TaxID=148814 RepID=UPI00200ABA2A|nr:GNAT family N-acetyltransferase [Apilactobacillus kunkeei]MCK8619433.1 GNAT family N-acetyltransferase [Apilactobacillus kunkeei]
MITFRNLSDNNDSSYWLDLYSDSFPTNQQIDFNDLTNIANSNDSVQMLLIQLNAQNVGIIYLVDFDDQAFILYLAIDANMRGNGLGKLTIKALKSRFKEGFILESESILVDSANHKQRNARYRFYTNNGMIDTDLATKDSDDEFHLLTSNKYAGVELYKKANQILGLDVDVIKYNK